MRTRGMVDLLHSWVLSVVASVVLLRAQAAAPCNSNLVTGPLGVEDHALTGPLPYGRDSRIHPKQARLHENINRFCAYVGSYLQVRLRKPSMITGFVTQGRTGNGQYVTEYSVMYSDTGNEWQEVTDNNGSVKLFTGNTNDWRVSETTLDTPIAASYIRVTPTAWKYYRGLRLEIKGCPIPQIGLQQTCWKAKYVTGIIPSSDMFITTRTNLGECGQECHGQEACYAFTFNQASGQCQGHSHSNLYLSNISDARTPNQHGVFQLFLKQNDCV